MVNMTTADNALKSYYLDAVGSAIDMQSNPFLAKIEKSTADVYGKDVKKLVRYGMNGGIGAGSETGDLPSAQSQQYVQFTSTLKNLYGTIEISDKAIRASQHNEGAFVNLLNDEMKSLVDSAKYNFGRMLYGNGSAVLAYVVSATGTTVKVDNINVFAENMLVDFLTIAGADITNGSARRIIKVDRAAKSITFEGENDLTEGTLIAGARVLMHGSKDYEITGLSALFSGSSLYGVSKTTHPWLKGYTATSVGSISETAIQKAIDEVECASGGKVDIILCSYGVRRALINYFRSNGTYLPTMKLEGGFTAIEFNGIPVVADKFCPNGTMYILNSQDFCIHQLCDWQWLEGEDGKVLKQVAGKPVYKATLVKYAELICAKPNGQACLTGITEA